MKRSLTRFSVALAIAVLTSSLAVFAQGKRPADPPPANPGFACGILTGLGVPQVVLDSLGCGS